MHQPFLENLKNEFHKSRVIVFAVFCFCMAATFSFLATSHPINTSAAPVQGFNPGNIISDGVMADYNSMTVEEIQAFLTSKNSCKNTDRELYEYQSKVYKTVSWHWSDTADNGHFVCLSEERFGEGTTIGTGQTAAEIIYEAAQASRINPRVLIVLLEKEQGLISDTFPHSGQYRSATGYGCPDTAACDSKYYGFKNQVLRAAELFRYTLDNGYYLYPENKSGVFVAYNPSSACGGTNVLIENRATAALYRYTPYQPNAAALAAGYGNGDACSAYGNRNFYLLFTDWFGSTQAKVDATGITIPDGEYSLAAKTSSDRALAVSGTNAQLAALNTADKSQRWRFERDASSGAYKITHVATNKVLDLYSNATSAGTNIQIYASDNSCGQRWKVYRTSDGYITLESACATGMVVDLASATQANANVQLNIFNKSTATQQWTLRVGQTVANGIYTIALNSDSSKSLDISGTFRDGANIQLWNANHTAAQQWQITYNSKGDYYTIQNPSSKRVLDVSGTMKDGANIQLWYSNNTCAQQWQIVPTSSSHYAIVSVCSPGYAIDLSGASSSNGSNIQLWHYNATAAQQWQITPASTPADGVYTIETNLAEQKVVDLLGGGAKDGDNAQLWYANATAAQQWQITRNPSEGYYTITNPKSGKVLDAASSSPKTSTNVRTWSSKDSCTQKWYIVESKENIYTLHSACDTGYVLDVSGPAKTGANIQLWYANATAAQQWQFHKAQ